MMNSFISGLFLRNLYNFNRNPGIIAKKKRICGKQMLFFHIFQLESIMNIIKSIIDKIRPKGALSLQIVFTLLAFFIMALTSYFFMRNIVNKNLVRNAESVFTFAKTQLESALVEPKTTLSGFSQTIRTMILRGDDVDDLSNYIHEISDYINKSGNHMMNANSFYLYLETNPENPVFIAGGNLAPPVNYRPAQRPWYKMALMAGGEVVETPPYDNFYSGDLLISFTRSLYSDNGARIGVVCMNIRVDDIGKNIVNIALDQGGNGMLISQNMIILAHSNPGFIGLNVNDPVLPFYPIAGELLAGNEVNEYPLKNWKGEDTIAYFRKISNGWYLGLMTPKVPFYRSITNMAVTLSILSLVFAGALIGILISIDRAKTKLDMVSRHKSAFLANMSHEIRTPMNAIIGMTTIGKSAPDPSRKDYCFTKIEDASNHLLGVINDILDMSKIEANKFNIAPVEFNFEIMLQQVVNVINFRVEERKQKL